MKRKESLWKERKDYEKKGKIMKRKERLWKGKVMDGKRKKEESKVRKERDGEDNIWSEK